MDIFLKLEGGPDARGESLAEGHKDDIEIQSFSWGANNPVSVTEAAGMGASRVSVSSLSLLKRMDRSSPTLFQACCAGAHFRSAVLTLSQSSGSGSRIFAQFRFEDVLIDSFQLNCMSSGGMDSAASESISLAFAKCTAGYRPQSSQGIPDKPVFGGWDMVANKPSASPLPMR
jgi:type VI secretion system secreted protein Hcp